MSSRFSAERSPLPPRPIFPDTGAARRRGSADAVDAQWQRLVLKWRWLREVHEIRRPGRAYPDMPHLLVAAGAAPRLRRLYPFTSHFTLCFSSRTSYPWAVQGGSIEALPTGGFKVYRHDPYAMVDEACTAEEAVVLAVGLLPSRADPVITGSTGECP
ncbi:DUF6193 family natural product biosynthesis protein [Streptomyces sp. NPDC005209]|uniref:DUF6193 family natural product biosynthesis protein n=1 Tax=Streptomyces sp. NPDC005209 TaxID=3156715 RepID=UPI0033A2B78A